MADLSCNRNQQRTRAELWQHDARSQSARLKTMKSVPRFWGVCAFLLLIPIARSQVTPLTISEVKIEHVGPPAVSDELIRANIRVKPGDRYSPAAVDDDVRNLYSTGFFYNI